MTEPAAQGIDDAVRRQSAPAQGAAATAAQQSSPGDADVITRNQDQVRSDVARWLVLTLVGVIAFYIFVGAIGASNCGRIGSCREMAESLAVIREFMSVALAAITGLVGAVTGFYFGAQQAKKP